MVKDFAPREYRGPTQLIRKGLLIIYTGNGKGKTTAAYGAVLRALGRGMKVAVVQFIKGRWISGEVNALKKFGRQITFLGCGEDFTWNTKDFKRDKNKAREGWKQCVHLLRKNQHQLFLFDELLYALKYRFLSLGEILKGLQCKSPQAHVIITGGEAPASLISKANLVSNIIEVKHPFRKGILAQPGIDF